MSKNAKILAVAATLAISASISTGAIVNTTNTNAKKVENTKLLVNNRLTESTNNLQNTIIQQYGNGWSNWNVGFDINTMKLTVPLASGNAIDPNFGEYMQYQLLNSDHKVLNTLNLKGTDGAGKVYELRQFSFKYGDILKITGSQLSFNKILVNGKETYNAFPILPYEGYGGLESVYFEITPNGLIPMTGGFKIINGQTYYFNNNGIMANNGWFVSENGKTMTTSQAVSSPNTSSGYKSYYFNEQGEMAKGLTNIGGSYYYFNTDTGVMETGLQTINGNIYYFNPSNGQMLTYTWVNINSQGQRTLNQVNGTTIQAYYLGANGIAEKGLQTIGGQIQYLNPETGSMELNKFITVDGNTYYLQPINGVAATGWQIINGHKYYFNSDGVMQTGAKEIDGKVYDFGSNGILQGINSVQISGASDTSINFGSNFNPMAGVTLIDQADPNAKISVSGSVNTKVPGKYKLTYTVKDSYGETATATREITVLDNYTISINGANNESINVGTKFNPMAGVTLNDPADSAAKIQVEGIVNVKVPGVYKLIYTVKDNYGKIATVTREITVQSNPFSLSLNTWDTNNALVMSFNNGTITTSGAHRWIGHSTNNCINITLFNSDGEAIKSIVTNGENFTDGQAGTPGSIFNGVQYKAGDKILISYTGGGEANGSFSYTYDGQTKKISNNSYFEITNSGLVPLKNTLQINGATNTNVNYGASFNPMAGVTLTDSANSNAKIQVNGSVNTKVPGVYKITYTVPNRFESTATVTREITVLDNYKVSINGTNNESIKEGTSFNPMAGVTLNDPADSTAKIQVEGAVNTKVPGTYKLTYTVKDSYGKTATATREITVQNNTNIKSNTEDLYWSGDSLVINGNIDSDSTFTHSTPKKLVIMNSEGQVIDSVNTTAVNWYSSNKNDYSGFQGILSASMLSKLVSNNTYGLYMDINGNYVPLISTVNNPYNKNYLLSTNASNQLTIAKNDGTMKTINEGTGSYIVGYFINNGYVINGNISLNNEVFSKGNTRVLLVKNAEGKVVDSINCAAMNWYSSNKNNYSNFQGIIPNSVLNKLGTGDSYTLSLEVIKDGQTYEMPINNTKHFILSNGVNYNITTNSKNNIIITKAQSYPVVNEGTSSLQSGYWEPYGYVMNIKADIGKEIPKGTQMELISKNLNGQIVSVTPGVDVNWYSSNKDNYNGFQAMITSKQLVEASTSNKLYVRVTIDGKTYESPVTGNLDTFGTGNLHYGFKTINNQINLIMK